MIDLEQTSDIREKAAELAEGIVLGIKDDDNIRATLEFFMRVSANLCALSDRPEELVAYFGSLVKESRDCYEGKKKEAGKEKGNDYPGGFYS